MTEVIFINFPKIPFLGIIAIVFFAISLLINIFGYRKNKNVINVYNVINIFIVWIGLIFLVFELIKNGVSGYFFLIYCCSLVLLQINIILRIFCNKINNQKLFDAVTILYMIEFIMLIFLFVLIIILLPSAISILGLR